MSSKKKNSKAKLPVSSHKTTKDRDESNGFLVRQNSRTSINSAKERPSSRASVTKLERSASRSSMSSGKKSALAV